MRLQEELVAGYGEHSLEGNEGMAPVIQDSEEQYEVERANPIGREIEEVNLKILDLRAENTACEIEPVLPTTLLPTPNE